MVEAVNLVKRFPSGRAIIPWLSPDAGIAAVDDVSLDVFAGETLGIVGEARCGKTTLARLLVRLLEPTSGELRFGGAEITSAGGARLRELRRQLQLLSGDPRWALNPRRTVGDSIAEPFAIHGLEADARGQRVRELIGRVCLSPEDQDCYPHELSPGERQRAAIARAVALRPKLLVADEPVRGLDALVGAQLLELLRSLQVDFGFTLVLVARELSAVRRMCDRVAVMYAGKIVELAPAEVLLASPQHPYTGALVAALPMLCAAPGDRPRRARELVTGDAPSLADPPAGCRFHPRCPKAQPVCAQQEPRLLDKPGGARAACHFPLTSDDGEAVIHLGQRAALGAPRAV
jgi:oligopeptide/dipeptide ABC transporter ATP-binding protein